LDVDSLGLSVYFAVGNYDMENRPLYEGRYGATYYHFTYQQDLFIVLDPNIDSWNISGVQKQFLEDVLDTSASQVGNVFVFFHQILRREANNQFSYIYWNSNAGRGSSVNFWPEIEPLFRSLSNEVVMFAGDLGASWSSDVTYDKYDNITLIATGMGDSDGENFVVVNVDSNKSISYDLICLSDSNLNCLGDLTDYLVVDDIVGLVDGNYDGGDDGKLGNLIYPNPATVSSTLVVNPNKETLIQLFNAEGQLVLEDKLMGKSRHTIDLSVLSRGLYLLKRFDGVNHHTAKLTLK